MWAQVKPTHPLPLDFSSRRRGAQHTGWVGTLVSRLPSDSGHLSGLRDPVRPGRHHRVFSRWSWLPGPGGRLSLLGGARDLWPRQSPCSL